MSEQDLAPGEWRLDRSARATTLAEYGARPVIGPGPDGANTQRTLPWSFVPKDVAFRVDVGRRVHANRSLAGKPGETAMYILGLAMSHACGVDLRGKEPGERAAIVGALTFGDLMYAAYCRRAEEDCGLVDLDLEEPVRCAKCGFTDLRAAVDLGTLALDVFDVEPRCTYRLKRPWSVRGVSVETLTLSPPMLNRAIAPWTSEDLARPDLRDLPLVAAAITEINGTPTLVTANDLTARDASTGRSLSGFDYDRLRGAAIAVCGGPKGVVDWVCKCGAKTAVRLEWATDFF